MENHYNKSIANLIYFKSKHFVLVKFNFKKLVARTFVYYITELDNFKLERTCVKNEHECKNSYGNKICVDYKITHIACANYSTSLCDDYSIIIQDYEAKKQFPYHRFLELHYIFT